MKERGTSQTGDDGYVLESQSLASMDGCRCEPLVTSTKKSRRMIYAYDNSEKRQQGPFVGGLSLLAENVIGAGKSASIPFFVLLGSTKRIRDRSLVDR